MDTKFDRLVAYDMVPPLKNHITLSNKFFPFIFFTTPAMHLLPHIVPL